MKQKILFFRIVLFIISIFLFSSSIIIADVLPFTPVIDGTKDAGWGSSPNNTTYTTKEPTSFNLEEGCYVTDDSAFVYFGIPTDNDPWGDGKSIHFHIAIDIRNTPTGGTTDAWGSSITYGQTYLPDYDVISQWSTDDQSVGWTGFQTWNTSDWTQTQLDTSYIAGGGDSFTEISIPRYILDDIAQGDTINISTWLRPDSEKPNACSCLPQDNLFPTDWGNSPAGSFTAAFSYEIQTGLKDIKKPTIASAQQYSKNFVDVTYNEPMDSISATNSSYYSIDKSIIVSSVEKISDIKYRLSTSTISGDTLYTVTISENVTDLAGNGVDPNNNTAQFTGFVYAPITFVVDDSEHQIFSGFYLKGSWITETGVYDSDWGGGVEHTQFYDDGTHGDTLASDNIYMVTVDLVSDDNVNTWQWGVDDQNHQWIDGNWEFWIPDDSPKTLIYAVPNIISQDVTVTFQVDMSFVGSVGTVSVAGTFNGWTPGADTLSDPDADDVYTTDILFTRGTNPNQEYKFVNGSNWESISNRAVEISDSSSTMVLEVDYFNIQNPDDIITSDVTVTFGVYMGALDTTWFNKGVSVQGNIDPLDWSQGSNLMSDGDEDMIFTKDILFPAGSNKYVEYKYTRCDNDSIWSYEDLGPNRTFTIDDSSPTQILDWVYWSDNMPVPANLDISVSGDNVEISWNAVFGATDYKVLRSSEPYDNFTEIDNTGGATNYTDPGVGSKYRAEKLFYQIKAVR